MKLDRRTLLASFLGLPLALEACRRAPAPALTGELVGADVTLGHRLREGLRPVPPADAWQDVDVAIVGAGVSGLSAAWRLLEATGLSISVLELEPEVGGTSRSGLNPISAYPWGAHYLPVPLPHSRALIRLLRDMDLIEGVDDDGRIRVPEQHLIREPEERYFWYGRWHQGLYPHFGEDAQDRAQLERFRREVDALVSWRDTRGRRAFTIPVSQCSDDAEITGLDRLSMATWLDQRGLSSSRLRWYVDYACRDDYGTRLEDTSAWAGLFYFASRMQSPGDESSDLMTWPEGNGRLVHWLRDRLGPRVQTACAVTELIPSSEPGGPVSLHLFSARTQQPSGLRARKVIFCAPLFLARHLVRPFREQPPPWAEHFDHSPWMVANLTLKDRPRSGGYPLCWDNVIVESPSLGYVTATHQALSDFGPTVLTYYYPLAGADVREQRKRLLETDWRGWADVTLSDLRRAHPDIDALVQRIDIMRWGHAMVRPAVGALWNGARALAAQPYRGIHFAHSDLSGLALFEEAHDHGVRAGEEVLEALELPWSTWR